MADEFQWLDETMERRSRIPRWAIESSWMVGVSRSEDRAWHYLGLFVAPRRRPVTCFCAEGVDNAPTVRLTPLAYSERRKGVETLLVGQCRECDQILWGRVA